MNEIKNIKEIAKIIDKARKLYIEDHESIGMYYTLDEYFAKKIFEKGYRCVTDLLNNKKWDWSSMFEYIIDLFIEFDEMGFIPSTTCPDPEGYAKEWKRKMVSAIYRLQKEIIDKILREVNRNEQ